MTAPGRAPFSVALDATVWDEPTTGIALYARSLAAALENQGVRVRRMGARSSGESPRGPLSKSAYTLFKLPFDLAGGQEPLFHAVCNFNLPLWRIRGKRLVLTVHDLIPEVLPSSVSAAFRWQFRLWLKRSLRVADRIICDSACSRADLIRLFGAKPERVRSVHLGVDHVYGVGEPDARAGEWLAGQGLPPEFVLYAGALDARKNIGILLDACQRLRGQGRPVCLVVAGQRWFGAGPIERRIERMRAEGVDVRPLGYQPAEVFYALMRRATVFAFPSRYEGFGLPPLEAMALGTPTIVSDAASLPEVCGEAAVQVSPQDADGLAAAIDRLLRSPKERLSRSEQGKRWAAQFTWEKTARSTLEVYRSALDGLG